MGVYRDIFELAAKLGSLEGYLYEQPASAPQYLSNWLGNIRRMYSALPGEARADFQQQYLEVLGKVSEHLDKLLGSEDPYALQVKQMLAEAGR